MRSPGSRATSFVSGCPRLPFGGNLPNLNGMVGHTEIDDFTFSYVFLGKVKDEEVPWNKISLCNRAFKIPGFKSGRLSERWLRVSALVFIPLRTWFRKISSIAADWAGVSFLGKKVCMCVARSGWVFGRQTCSCRSWWVAHHQIFPRALGDLCMLGVRTRFLRSSSVFPQPLVKIPERPVAQIFFHPVVLRYNWHAVLCKFNVYGIMIWCTYIMKWLSQWI